MTNNETKKIVYRGKAFNLCRSDRYFKRTTTVNGKETTLMLHRVIWEDHFGKIPEGYLIHHIDGNQLNNAIENLECISPKEHSERHPGFIEWRRSAEVVELNTERIRRIQRETPIRKAICEICGKEFTYKQAVEGNAKVCSAICRSRKIRMTYTKTYVCAYCGKEFTRFIGKYPKFCSRSCAMYFRHRGAKQ